MGDTRKAKWFRYTRGNIICNGWACRDCVIWHDNGDDSGMEDDYREDFHKRFDAGTEGMNLTLGMLSSEHSCQDHVTLDEFGDPEGACFDNKCDCPTQGDLGGECECEHVSFTWSPCDVCNSNLGGDRDAMTFWETDIPARFPAPARITMRSYYTVKYAVKRYLTHH